MLVEGLDALAEAAAATDGTDDAVAGALADPRSTEVLAELAAARERIDEFTLTACGTTLAGDRAAGVAGVATGDAEQLGADDPEEPPPTDEPELEALAEDCFDGSGSACDELYFTAEVGSPEEGYGDTCGGRFDESPGPCATAIGE